ncbi:MAG: DegT/DnrJ/EryC1/StrS family aminotransferase [Dehalococcoidales bacterium]|nr:DegT/DnrJ/EryC1/StrS family aminotransferase [Dehalococcoidales bacterium]
MSRGKPGPQQGWWGEPNLGGWYTDAEINAVVNTIRESNNWWTGFGPRPREIEVFEQAFARYCGTRYAVAVNGGGTGIDMAIRCLDLQIGDEVICPAINYKSAHMAILDQGGRVVFCDVCPDTLNVDLADVEKRITQRTRAIFPVHMNGLSAPMDELLELAEKYSLPGKPPIRVFGDAARACGAGYKRSKVGAKGWMNIFSFQTQKHMTTLGEGGMVVTDDPVLNHRLRNIRQFGGEEEWGSNYKMTKVQAAVGLVQLARLDEMNERRRTAAQRRTDYLGIVPELTLPKEPAGYYHVYYVYAILVNQDWSGEKRDLLIEVMKNQFGISCSITNPPTYRRWPYIAEKCGIPQLPVSEDIGNRLFCMPLHPLLTDEQERYICASLLESIDIIKREQ